VQTYDLIELTLIDSVAVLRLQQPEQLNPLGIAMQQQLRACLADLSHHQDLSVLVITGAGKAFCVGADLTSIDANQSNQTLGQHVGEAMRTLSNRLIEDIRALPFPVVSAVNGPCAGAGVSLALAADIVIGARSAYFFLSFMPRLGIVPDLGSTWFLERFIGRPRALGLTLLGDRLSAEQAQAWGLIWSCVDDEQLMPEAMRVAQRLAKLPVHAALEMRRALDSAAQHDLLTQMAYEAGRQANLIDRPEFSEGLKAFLEKREPAFPRSRHHLDSFSKLTP
jgi:2-(1,2-epoxy-1,2-dihydrophenyl)acetyl-CoA isomerase